MPVRAVRGGRKVPSCGAGSVGYRPRGGIARRNGQTRRAHWGARRRVTRGRFGERHEGTQRATEPNGERRGMAPVAKRCATSLSDIANLLYKSTVIKYYDLAVHAKTSHQCKVLGVRWDPIPLHWWESGGELFCVCFCGFGYCKVNGGSV